MEGDEARRKITKKGWGVVKSCDGTRHANLDEKLVGWLPGEIHANGRSRLGAVRLGVNQNRSSPSSVLGDGPQRAWQRWLLWFYLLVESCKLNGNENS